MKQNASFHFLTSNVELYVYDVCARVYNEEVKEMQINRLQYFTGVDAIQCYQCNSKNNSQCSELIPPDAMKIDCSDLRDGAKYTMCRKITQVIEFSVNGRTC